MFSDCEIGLECGHHKTVSESGNIHLLHQTHGLPSKTAKDALEEVRRRNVDSESET